MSNKEKSFIEKKKTGSLAKCYKALSTKKANKDPLSPTTTSSAKKCVREKVRDAVEAGSINININTTDQQPTPVDWASIASSTVSTNVTRRASGSDTITDDIKTSAVSAIANDTQGVTSDSELSATSSAEEVRSTGSHVKTKGPELKSATSSDESKISNEASESTVQKAFDHHSEAGVSEEKIKEKVIDRLTAVLTDPQLIWEQFFSGIVTDYASDAVEENLVEKQLDFTHSKEIKSGSNRALHRLENVCNLPLKLILTPLQRGKVLANTFASLLEMQFGPLHAALQVGNVILEWNDSDLVTPYLCNYEDELHVMKVDMQPQSEWVKYTTQNNPKMKEAAKQLDFTEQIDQIYIVTSKKKEMIDALIAVIIKYNTFYSYNLFDRNCQHFVIDALKALQVENPTGFTGGLSDYFKTLVKGHTPSIPKQFETHQDLDAYVMRIKQEGSTENMPQHDLEFILTLYFRFHLESKEELRKNGKALEEWKCQEANCQMEDLEQLIEMESLKLHGFRQ